MMNNNNKLINTDLNTSGIFKAKLIDYNGDLRVYIPGITGGNAYKYIDGNYISDVEKYDKCKKSLCIPKWCVPNIQAQRHEQVQSCWVTFENGDIKRPIIMGWVGSDIIYAVSGIVYEDGDSVVYNPDGTKRIYKGDGTTGNTNADEIFRILINAGASIGGAIACLANMWHECTTFDTRAVKADTGATGICQWLDKTDGSGRFNELKNGVTITFNGDNVTWSKPNDPYSITSQTNFFIFELKYKDFTNVKWDNITTQYSDITSVKDLVWKLARYYEVFTTKNSPSELTGDELTHWNDTMTKVDLWWESFTKNGDIQILEYTDTEIYHKIVDYISKIIPDETLAIDWGTGTGTQCVELPKHYIDTVFGLNAKQTSTGNGDEFYEKMPKAFPQHFESLKYTEGDEIRVGDILSQVGVNGHAVIVKSVNGNTFTTLEQWDGSIYIKSYTITAPGTGADEIIGIARPKYFSK